MTDASKRIPKSLGTDPKLIGSYTITDVAVALFPAVLVVLVIQLLLPESLLVGGFPVSALTLPLAGLAVAVGATFVYLTPSYMTSLDWLWTVGRFHRGTKAFDHRAAAALTRIERVHPVEGAIERTDGVLLAMVRVEPPSMALATDDEWRTMAEAFADFCNTVVEFPIQIYSTTRPFPVDDYLGRFRSRLDDEDVKANPRLASLIENYVEWYATELAERRMTVRDHSVVVTVRPEDVQFEVGSLTRKLAVVPIVGSLVRVLRAPGRKVQREAMFDALDDRTRRVVSGLRSIEGCHARRVDVGEATRLVAEYWAGEPLDYGDMGRVLRTRPIVGGRS